MELPGVGEKMIAQPSPTTKPFNAPGWGGSRNGTPRNGAEKRPLCPPVFVLISQAVAEFQIWNACSGSSSSSSSCRNASGPPWLCYGSQTCAAWARSSPAVCLESKEQTWAGFSSTFPGKSYEKSSGFPGAPASRCFTLCRRKARSPSCYGGRSRSTRTQCYFWALTHAAGTIRGLHAASIALTGGVERAGGMEPAVDLQGVLSL